MPCARALTGSPIDNPFAKKEFKQQCQCDSNALDILFEIEHRNWNHIRDIDPSLCLYAINRFEIRSCDAASLLDDDMTSIKWISFRAPLLAILPH